MIFNAYVTLISGIFSLGTHAATTLARCNADNCYRALFPCPSPSAVSSASAFCATITAGGTTATDFPARASSACGTVASRYISACGCGPTCSVTPTPTPTPCPAYGGLLANGDFECGISPWTVEVPDAGASTTITPSSSNSGGRSFEAKLLQDRPRQEPVLSVSASSNIFSVEPNVPCKLTFALWFDNMDAGFVGIKFNGAPVRTVDARDGAGWGVWKSVSIDYTPSSDRLQVKFEFLYGRVASVVRLDSVVFNYLH
ncbi:hypothetical protein LY78DRAFT_664304 [Colletotrichum sublineola]|nr:hypothetical protein LY78DRAFT_664304 [Colletotrichum sublineola]